MPPKRGRSLEAASAASQERVREASEARAAELRAEKKAPSPAAKARKPAATASLVAQATAKAQARVRESSMERSKEIREEEKPASAKKAKKPKKPASPYDDETRDENGDKIVPAAAPSLYDDETRDENGDKIALPRKKKLPRAEAEAEQPQRRHAAPAAASPSLLRRLVIALVCSLGLFLVAAAVFSLLDGSVHETVEKMHTQLAEHRDIYASALGAAAGMPKLAVMDLHKRVVAPAFPLTVREKMAASLPGALQHAVLTVYAAQDHYGPVMYLVLGAGAVAGYLCF